MIVKNAFGIVAACVLLLGCERNQPAPVTLAPSEGQIKEMISQAAGIPGDVFLRLLEKGGVPNREEFPDHYFTQDLVSMRPEEGNVPDEARRDFRMEETGMPDPAALADALVGGRSMRKDWKPGYASVIRPPYITELASDRSGDRITGSAAFEVKGLYAGRIEFTLSLAGDEWRVTRLAMPGRNLALQRAEDGTWQPATQ